MPAYNMQLHAYIAQYGGKSCWSKYDKYLSSCIN